MLSFFIALPNASSAQQHSFPLYQKNLSLIQKPFL